MPHWHVPANCGTVYQRVVEPRTKSIAIIIADAVIDRIARKPRTIHIEDEESTRKRMGGTR